ncbi:MAG: dockerin type I repeat-containing protein [Prevotella sp.]|nr:dockerin type I repeat-containing protein [Prevotella sp.]
MKKLKMFFAGALLAIAGNAMAQTVTLTANEAADKNGGWTLQVKAPADIAGWQMLVNLPAGLTIEGTDLTVGGATFTKYDVALPAAYSDKYKVVGTQTAEGGYFLFCFPLADSYAATDLAKQAGSGDGDICTINLKAAADANLAGPQPCTVTQLATTDEAGVSTTGADLNTTIGHPVGDVTNDFALDVRDNALVLQYILGKTTEVDTNVADVNKDAEIDVRDLAKMLNIILGKE